jgi:hypothetical protein
MTGIAWAIVFAIGFALGLARLGGRRVSAARCVPGAAAALALLGYVCFMLWVCIWTASCPRCPEDDGDRLYYLPLYALTYAGATVVLLLSIAFGAVVAGTLGGREHRKRG